MIETNSFEDNKLSNMNGKNNQSSAYKELNNSLTNDVLDTNLPRCHKSGNENISEIVKPIEVNSNNEYLPETNLFSVDNKKDVKMSLHPLTNVSNSEQSIDLNYNFDSSVLKTENFIDENETELQSENVSKHISQNSFPREKTQSDDQQINTNIKPTNFERSNSRENNREKNSSSYLPDILTSLKKSEADDKRRKSDTPSSDSDSIPKSKSLLTQTSYLPNQLRSEALQNEIETELKQLKNLHSLQSIYKFAYDENVTDQSDAGSKSPSPLDPESNVPSSLTSAEILIHEADSGSDAGSEDVELIPHRYESETFLSENKHMYVNKLSLAVELLRTQETLPYDDEFKRVTGENRVSNNLMAREERNIFLVEDSSNSNALTSQSQVKQTFKCSSDTREESLEDFNMQEATETERRGNRKFGVHQYISQKRAVSMDPWICCTIM